MPPLPRVLAPLGKKQQNLTRQRHVMGFKDSRAEVKMVTKSYQTGCLHPMETVEGPTAQTI
jgi:hypothetical protein